MLTPDAHATVGDPPHVAFVGTYTPDVEGNEAPPGIYRLDQDASGRLSEPEPIANLINPSFLALSPDGQSLYAVSELWGGRGTTGFVHTYRVQDEGTLTFINRISSGGESPCHVRVDHSGHLVFTANYGDGIVRVFDTDSAGGLRTRQTLDLNDPDVKGPARAHSVTCSPDNRYAYVCDLGQDRIWIFQIVDEGDPLVAGEVPFLQLPKGSGPRHFTFHPELERAYVINELGSTIVVLAPNAASGALEPLQTLSTLPADFTDKNYCADIHIHPNGRWLYGSNRGHNSIFVAAIDADSGTLTPLQHIATGGDWPRNFAIDPTGRFLHVAHQRSQDIVSFAIDPATGQLTATEGKLEMQSPVCILFQD